MYWTYLRRELSGRKRQTIIVATGLAVAIALVIVVSALSAGVRDAQAQALESVYGVGTDLTVTGATQQPGAGGQGATGGTGGGRRFDFGNGAGATADGTTTLSQSRLFPDFRRGTLDASSLTTVKKADGVAGASAALSLTDTSFSGQLPSRFGGQGGGQAGAGAGGTAGGDTGGGAPTGGSDGAGGSSFNVDSFTVLGVDPGDAAVGPLSAVTVTDGRAMTSADKGADIAVIDATYATSKSLAVGGTIDVGGTSMQIVGILASTSDTADTASDVYIPLDVAQTLAGTGDVISTIYVQATSSSAIGSVQTALQAALPDATVSSEADLAAAVSGSLSSASSLITNLGTWLSIIVLVVALAIAVLFTISGVSRRTREFGTLKAIGWSNGRVVGQVAGESVVQGLIGGAAGLIIGLVGIWVVNIISPTISSPPSAFGGGAGRAGGFAGGAGRAAGAATGGGGFGGGGGGFGRFAQSAASEITLHAPLTIWVIVAAIGLAVLGGLIAGAFGGWRAARLSPSEALRSVG